MLGALGAVVWAQWDEVRHVAAVIGTVFCIAFWPRSWVRTVRKAFARQVLAIGVEPLWFVGAVAVFVGISVVVQLSFWAGEAGQSQLLGPLLVAVVARELGPVLINLVVIVRSGSAMTTELGVCKIKGEVRALEAGADAFVRKDEDMTVILARLTAMLRTAGFEQTRYHNLTGGIVAVHRGYKI
jgi:phospholipid/cholesterol/gamma-HCH transport system permease protein